jgi:hypothetical protein
VHFAYPDSITDVNFTEVNLSVFYKVFSFSYAVLADDAYLFLSADFEIAPDVNLSINVVKGTYDFYAGERFISYGASLSKDGLALGVLKIDLDNTDMKVFLSYTLELSF